MSASLREAIEAAGGRVAAAYTAAEAKGATMPTTQNLANLADAIASISGGGGTDGLQKLTMQVTIVTKSCPYELVYDLPRVPRFILMYRDYTVGDGNYCPIFCECVFPINFIGNVSGYSLETNYLVSYIENRANASVPSSFNSISLISKLTNTSAFLRCRNVDYGFIGTYNVEIYY